jgi:hypothetical protein
MTAHGLFEIRPHISTTMTAGLADKSIFNIAQPEIIRPAIAADCDRVAAAEVGAVSR